MSRSTPLGGANASRPAVGKPVNTVVCSVYRVAMIFIPHILYLSFYSYIRHVYMYAVVRSLSRSLNRVKFYLRRFDTKLGTRSTIDFGIAAPHRHFGSCLFHCLTERSNWITSTTHSRHLETHGTQVLHSTAQYCKLECQMGV